MTKKLKRCYVVMARFKSPDFGDGMLIAKPIVYYTKRDAEASARYLRSMRSYDVVKVVRCDFER